MRNGITEFYDNRAYKELYQEELRDEIKSNILMGKIFLYMGIFLSLLVLFIIIITHEFAFLLLLTLIGVPCIGMGLYAIKESKKRFKELNKQGYFIQWNHSKN